MKFLIFQLNFYFIQLDSYKWCVGSWIVHYTMKWDNETMKITELVSGEMNQVCDHFDLIKILISLTAISSLNLIVSTSNAHGT